MPKGEKRIANPRDCLGRNELSGRDAHGTVDPVGGGVCVNHACNPKHWSGNKSYDYEHEKNGNYITNDENDALPDLPVVDLTKANEEKGQNSR